MKLFERYISLYFLAFFLLLALFSFTLYINNQRTTQWNYLFNIVNGLLYVSGGVVALYGTRLHGFRSSVGRELFSIAIGMIGFAVGLFIWSYYNLFLNVDTPYPSFADIFFVLYIPFIAYGIINLLREFGLFFSKKILFQSVGIFILAGIFIFFYGNPPDLAATTPFLEKAVNIFYLIGDSFLITLGIMLIRLTEGRIHKSFFFFIGALFVMALADFNFGYRTGADIYWNGDITDVLFALSGFLFSLGVTKVVAVQLKLARIND